MQAGIKEIRIFDPGDGYYRVKVTKTFEPQYGGGESTIDLGVATEEMHRALDAARSVFTCHRADREGFEATKA